jgi:nucleotide-binding universal stress UspA family protein
MQNIETILHPTDFSEPSANAFGFACTLARALNARLLVLHVYPPPICHGEVVARRQPNGFHELLWKELRAVLSPEPQVCVEHMLEEGDAASEILRVARKVPCDLIVMGTHGRTGLGRLLMGSVAERVLRRAPCPVLAVKSCATPPQRQPAELQHTGANP